VFTGEELAKAHLLHMTNQEILEYHERNRTKTYIHSQGFFATLKRRLFPGKIYLIRFKDGKGVIIMAKNERDACIQAVPFVDANRHRHKDPYYDSSCEKCRVIFDELADKFNNSSVTWLGWGQPDYNWVISV
jgi:hypothetical protein